MKKNSKKSNIVLKKLWLQDFFSFLKEYKIADLAIGFVISNATTALIRSLVENIIMPFIAAMIKDETWKTATFNLGPIALKWGAFLAELINFIILSFVVFVIVKKILKAEKEEIKNLGIKK